MLSFIAITKRCIPWNGQSMHDDYVLETHTHKYNGQVNVIFILENFTVDVQDKISIAFAPMVILLF